MTKALAATSLFLLLLTFHVDGQARKPKTAAKAPTKATPAPTPAFPGYTFIVEMAPDKSLRIQIRTGYDSWERDPATLKKALAEYIAMQEPKLGQPAIPARVVVRAAESLDMKSVVELLKTARQGASELSLDLGDYDALKIPPEPDDRPNFDVKPDPLTLVAAFDDKGAVTLNSAPHGNLPDLSKIQSRLKEIFKAREDNGVFRENTNEVEKTVFVRAPLSSRFADVKTFAKALGDVGADHIWLQIDDLDATEKRRELIDLDSVFSVPKPKPRPKRKPNE